MRSVKASIDRPGRDCLNAVLTDHLLLSTFGAGRFVTSMACAVALLWPCISKVAFAQTIPDAYTNSAPAVTYANGQSMPHTTFSVTSSTRMNRTAIGQCQLPSTAPKAKPRRRRHWRLAVITLFCTSCGSTRKAGFTIHPETVRDLGCRCRCVSRRAIVPKPYQRQR